MRRLAIAAVVVAGALSGAPAASAGGPDLGTAPCADVQNLFAMMYIYVQPLPEPVGSVVYPVAGAAYRTVCGITG